MEEMAKLFQHMFDRVMDVDPISWVLGLLVVGMLTGFGYAIFIYEPPEYTCNPISLQSYHVEGIGDVKVHGIVESKVKYLPVDEIYVETFRGNNAHYAKIQDFCDHAVMNYKAESYEPATP